MLLSCLTSWGRQLDLGEAMSRLADSMLPSQAKGKGPDYRLAHTSVQDGQNVMYIVNRQGGGILFLAADDHAPALLGYTDEGAYTSAEDLPDNMRSWLQQYEQGIAAAIRYDVQLPMAASASSASVAPMLTSKWGQWAPYNKQCVVAGEKCNSGCVAVAMAQIMRYHQWPVTGTGAHSYKCNGTTLTRDFSAHTYKWDLMPDESYGASAAQEDAIAELIHDCGVSVNMAYTTSASSAYTDITGRALFTYFGYDKGCHNVYRCYETDEEWQALLLSELQAGRPVLYAGSSVKEGGHAFVCDGYDGNNGLFHFNWGWSGSYNGYFSVCGTNQLNCYLGSNATKGENTDYAFSGSQMICVGIQPDKGSAMVDMLFGMMEGFKLSAPTMTRSQIMYTTTPKMHVVSNETSTFIYGTELEDGIHSYISIHEDKPLTFEQGLYYSVSRLQFSGRDVPFTGTYRAHPVVKDATKNDAKWTRVLMPVGFEVPTVNVTGTDATLYINSEVYADSPSDADLKRNSVHVSDIAIHVDMHTDSRLTNSEVYGILYTETGVSMGYFLQEVNAAAGEDMHLTFTNDHLVLYSGYAIEANKRYKLVMRPYGGKAYPPSGLGLLYFSTVPDLPKPPALKGDVNGDNIVNEADAELLTDLYVHGDPEQRLDPETCDVNGDGEVNTTDAVCIIKIIQSKKQ